MASKQQDAKPQVLSFPLLSEDKRDHANLLKTSADHCGVLEKDIEDMYPCTARQVWILSTMETQPETCVGRFFYKLPPDIDLAQFQAAWTFTVEANSILRTRLIQNELGAFQVVVREKQEFLMCDKLDTYLKTDLAEAMKPGSSFVRVAIIQPEDEFYSYSFALTIHHALFDHPSLSLVLAQVEASYKGEKLPLRPFCQFFANTTSLDRAASQRFWKHQFHGIDAAKFPITPLPEQVSLISRASHEYTMDIPYREELGFRLPAMIQLAWGIVICHYTDSEDVLYGLSMPAQDVSPMEHLTGPVTATVPLRMQLKQDRTIRASLDAITAQSVARIGHERLGLLEIGKISSESFRACAYMSHLTINHATEQLLDQHLFGNRFRELNGVLATCALDISCSPSIDNMRLMGAFNFDAAILDKEEVQRLACQFDHVLQQIRKNINQLARDVQVLSPLDLSQLECWNSVLSQADDRCIHEIVLDQCESHKESVAVSSWDGTFLYQELVDISSVISCYLVDIGVSPKTMVLLAFEKSKWQSVVVLAVLRAGGSCIPIDSSEPVGRIQAIIQDTGASIAMVSPANETRLQGVGNIVVVSQSLVDRLQPQPGRKLPSVSPFDVAFVFYTSGSSGKPKGVVMEHRNTATGIRNLNTNMNLHPGLRVVHSAPYAFDVSMHEMLTAFLTGGCLCIPSESEQTDLANFIQEQHINWAVLTPSKAAELSPYDLPTLKTLVLTGEAMSRSESNKWAGHLTLLNAFGPTETAFYCTIERIRATGWRSGSVGPVVNGVGWITRPNDPSQLCAIGAIGELLIEGPALAREYLNDVQRTANAFIQAPPWFQHFRGRAGRLYRTGDLVHYNGDGSLRFIGRQDSQVKIRGERVELGEVEYHVRQSLASNFRVVAEVITPSGSDYPMLVVFLALTQEPAVSSDHPAVDLRQVTPRLEARLAKNLPSYMMPKRYIPIDQVPIKATGKTNRRRLRELGGLLTLDQLGELSFNRNGGEFRAPVTV